MSKRRDNIKRIKSLKWEQKLSIKKPIKKKKEPKIEKKIVSIEED